MTTKKQTYYGMPRRSKPKGFEIINSKTEERIVFYVFALRLDAEAVAATLPKELNAQVKPL